MSIITNLLEASAAKKENRLKQKLLDQSATISRDIFDTRMTDVRASDARTLDLNRRGYDAQSGNQAKTFADLLANSTAGFDEQTGIADETFNDRQAIERTAFDQQMEALGGLVTAQRGARLKMQEAAASERQRQRAFQGEADDLAAALPGQVGFDAQAVGRDAALADRLALIQDTVSRGEVPAWAKTAAGAFAAAQGRGYAESMGDATATAKVSAYGDAYQGAERTMGRTADDISGLTRKAEISRQALPAELGVGQLEGEQGKERADFATALAKEVGQRRDQIVADRGEGRSRASERYRGATDQTRSRFGEQMQGVFDDYFGGSIDAEGRFISGITGASTNLENKLLNLNNFKMNNTRVTSPLANTLRAFEQAAAAAAGGA